jgi:serine O-acetyltransferase
MLKLEVVSPLERSPWVCLRTEAFEAIKSEPGLASMLHAVILSHDALSHALSFQLARKLADDGLSEMTLREIIQDYFDRDPSLIKITEADLEAYFERDPATLGYLQPFMFYKGFLSLQTHRIAHRLWAEGRKTLAHHLQSRVSELFQIDIHPAAKLGAGLFMDHGTGIVIGETAVIGEGVSMLHAVTLGGTGAAGVERHPKIGNGVLLGAGAKVLGNIYVGDYAKIAAGSVVLKPVPAHCTAAGVPARLVNCKTCPDPAKSMDHTLSDIVYDYVI